MHTLFYTCILYNSKLSENYTITVVSYEHHIFIYAALQYPTVGDNRNFSGGDKPVCANNGQIWGFKGANKIFSEVFDVLYSFTVNFMAVCMETQYDVMLIANSGKRELRQVDPSPPGGYTCIPAAS